LALLCRLHSTSPGTVRVLREDLVLQGYEVPADVSYQLLSKKYYLIKVIDKGWAILGST